MKSLLITSLIFIIGFTCFNISPVSAQSQEYVIDGKPYVLYDVGISAGLWDGSSEITAWAYRASVDRMASQLRAAARSAVAQGKGFMFYGGCAFYLSVNGETIAERVTSENLAIRMRNTVTPSATARVVIQPVDLCKNIKDLQEQMPTGYVDVGNGICRLDTTLHVFCRPVSNIVKPGDTVKFVASTINAVGDVNYTWTDTNGSNIGTGLTVSRVFSDQGTKQVKVSVKDSKGQTETRTCSVTVANNSSGAPRLVPAVSAQGGGITNTTCPMTWTSKDVDECFLVTEGKSDKPIELSGKSQIEPGKYKVRCTYSSFGAVEYIDSELITCRRNPDVREI